MALTTLNHAALLPGSVLQVKYEPNSIWNNVNIRNKCKQSNNRGTSSISFTRKQADSFILVKVGCSVNRVLLLENLSNSYRLNYDSDVVTYCTDNDRTVRKFVEFQDTTTGSIGDTVAFESVFVNTASFNDNEVVQSFSVMEIAV